MHEYVEPQPLKVVLAARRISNRALARAVGRSNRWVGLVVNGLVEPSDALRTAIAAALDEPEEKLFRQRAARRPRWPGDETLLVPRGSK